MTLIKSISGIRGTIGGIPKENLTPVDVVRFASAYGMFLKNKNLKQKKLKVIIGRDARISGNMLSSLTTNTLMGLGINVIDLGLSTTPTVAIAVALEQADGGIILTASHNPKQWNALKLFDEKGEFLNAVDGNTILKIAEKEAFVFAQIKNIGSYKRKKNYIKKHIKEVLKLDLVAKKAIKKAKFKVVVDGVNSTGGIAVPMLLKALGVKCVKLYCKPDGNFPHNPEPLKEHLTDLSELVVKKQADLGIVVDPDVDRLAFITEDGAIFGEEYTLVACADYVLNRLSGGNTVSNLSSTSALKDITEKYGGKHSQSAVGEVNVVEQMKATNAVIGGEGNGGVIYPASHYGRDSLVGIALFLSHLTRKKMSCKTLRNSYPTYFMSKSKIELTPQIKVDALLKKISARYKTEDINTIDGLKITFDKQWVHLRKSNTEPIIRIYTEAVSKEQADHLAKRFMNEIAEFIT